MKRRRGLSLAAEELRAIHAAIAVVELIGLGYIWGCVITGRRAPHLELASGVLVAEGVGLAIGGGDCPLGPLQERVGDPVPLFELVLPPTAARRAVPVLAGVAISGILLAAVRPGYSPQGLFSKSPGRNRIASDGGISAGATATSS